jgi:hypothetical protein
MSELTIPVGMKLPDNVTFHMRVRDEMSGRWLTVLIYLKTNE